MSESRNESLALELETRFADAARAPSRVLEGQVRLITDHPLVKVVLEAVQGYVLVLNEQRQILAANSELVEALQRDNGGTLVGLRPGEALNCIHFNEGPNGCGTGDRCRGCGAVLTILASQQSGASATGECRLMFEQNGQLVGRVLQVRATPLKIDEHNLTAFVLHDISGMKRREVLERLLLHDMLNTLGGIEIWTELLSEEDPKNVARQILTLSQYLRDEIEFQQKLLEAEEGDLITSPRSVRASEVLSSAEEVFRRHRTAEGKSLKVVGPAEDANLVVDVSLLVRVLTNMVLNALEATEAGGRVRLWFEMREGRPTFAVHNAGVIPEEVQRSIFDRSFTTKGPRGRGLGAYSMKLFGEQCLGGTVAFRSTEADGTEFVMMLPPQGKPPASGAGQGGRSQGKPERKAPERPRGKTSGSGQGGGILLVDDDEVVIKLCRKALERLGHEVVSCTHADEALEQFRNDPGRYQLVLTDVSMPDVDGLELSREILRIRPDTPILVCSGYTDEMTAEQAFDAGAQGFLKKPCTVQELREAVLKLISSSP